jgi:hypothetical protein
MIQEEERRRLQKDEGNKLEEVDEIEVQNPSNF